MSETLEEFYYRMLEIECPRIVVDINRDSKTREVIAINEYKTDALLLCSECNKPGELHALNIRTLASYYANNYLKLAKPDDWYEYFINFLNLPKDVGTNTYFYNPKTMMFRK